MIRRDDKKKILDKKLLVIYEKVLIKILGYLSEFVLSVIYENTIIKELTISMIIFALLVSYISLNILEH